MSGSPWGRFLGAVSLTFDDGTQDQLSAAVPLLDAAGVRGTFYLLPQGDAWRERLAPWQEVAAKGHEIGNHSLAHHCSGTLSGNRGGLEELSLEQFEADVLEAERRLETVFPGRTEWSFAYPCYNTFVGRGVDRRSTVPVIARRFLAGRGGGELGFGNRPELVDLACVCGQPVEGRSGYEMIGLVEAIAARGQWLVLVLHKVDGDRLSVSSSDLQMLLEHLQRRENEIWTAPFIDVARAVSLWQQQNTA